MVAELKCTLKWPFSPPGPPDKDLSGGGNQATLHISEDATQRGEFLQVQQIQGQLLRAVPGVCANKE
jgi:hypothetical protein